MPACTGSSSPLELGGRQQINDITSFIDGSMVYGSDATLAGQLRQFSGGRLRVGRSIPPGAKPSLPLDPSGCLGCFLAGDTRVNEQIGLTTLHTIFMREHNRVASILAGINPNWNDEKLYQEARKIVGAQIQRITYYEFLPAVMGKASFNSLIGQYTGYNPVVNPSVPTEFSTAAFRFGHSLVKPSFSLLDRTYSQIGGIPLVSAFVNPSIFSVANGTDQILRGLLTTNSRRSDEYLVSTLTNELFATNSINPGYNSGTVGSDLASLNIQRGRDHGLPPYSTVRNYCQRITGLKPTFKNDITLIRALQTYGSLDTADLWPLGLAETPLAGSLIGPTFSCLFADAFKALRSGDRFYFENPNAFNRSQLDEIKKSTMSRIICDNADNISLIEPNAFLTSGRRTPCSNLSMVNLNAWKDFYQPQTYKQCAFKVTIGPTPIAAWLESYPHIPNGLSRPTWYYAYIQPSNATTYSCIPFQCPSTVSSVLLTLDSSNYKNKITPVISLPGTRSIAPYIYSAYWTASVLASPGVYTSVPDCQAGLIAAFDVNYIPAEAEISCNPRISKCFSYEVDNHLPKLGRKRKGQKQKTGGDVNPVQLH